jgi:TrmH family RNA methyltransferase
MSGAQCLSAPRLLAIFEEIRDPGNAGTVIRAADAAGADAVIFTEASVDPTSPKVIRASAGSYFHLPVIGGANLEALANDLEAQAIPLLAADGEGTESLDTLQDLVSVLNGADQAADRHRRSLARKGAAPEPTPTVRTAQIDLRAPTAWLFGNEARGLSAGAMDLATATVRIPLRGKAESLNVAMAATLCLFASARAQS